MKIYNLKGPHTTFIKMHNLKGPHTTVSKSITLKVDASVAALIPVYFQLWSTYRSDKLAGVDDGLGLDIPSWATELFENGFAGSVDSMTVLSHSDCSAQKSSVKPAVEKKPTRWGRCMHPTCTGRAMKPALGRRGPFLVCNRHGCQGKRNLSVQQWKQLPREWLKWWPVNWATVSWHKRPVWKGS